jgi:hypothetical protein
MPNGAVQPSGAVQQEAGQGAAAATAAAATHPLPGSSCNPSIRHTVWMPLLWLQTREAP